MKLALVPALLITLVEPTDSERRAQAPVSLVFVAYSSQPDTIGVADSSRVHVDAVWMAMQDVRVRPQASCKRATAKTLIAGAFTVELAKRISTAAAASPLDVGRYCALELQLRRSRGRVAGAPGELRGASIVVQGRRADGMRFVLRSRLDTAPLLQAHGLEGFAVAEAPTSWIIGVELSRWFAGVDLAVADVAGEGQAREVRIDEKSNPELLAAFNANVERGMALFDDRNADRRLDPEERANPIAAGR